MSNNQIILVIVLLCFAAVSCKKPTTTFPNIIDLKNSPTSVTDEGLNAFFDLGSWMGFALSDDTTSTTKPYPSRTHVVHKGKKGMIALDQIRTIDKARIIKGYSTITKSNIKRVKSVLKEMLID